MFKCVVIILSVIFAIPTQATELPKKSLGHNSVLHGGNSLNAKANRDTVILIGPWGSGALTNGQFQTPNGAPAWNEWTHYDITQSTSNHWHISDYNADTLNDTPNNMAMYCGDESIPACTMDDVDGGYGNSWRDYLQFNYTVENPAESCEVTISGVFNHNTEPGYDYTNFLFENASGLVPMASIDGVGTAVAFTYSMIYTPEDYIGDDQDQVRFEIRVTSDGAWSDADCLYSGNGACQVDDLRVQCSNGSYDNTSDFQNGVNDDWVFSFPPGTGDFADLWVGLHDLDPCKVNYSPQVAFIDDGTKVPGVGPTYCIDWCYGPGGYIVNNTGGAAFEMDPDAKLRNAIESPIISWPGPLHSGAIYSFDVYRHEPLAPDSPNIFFTWSIRSAVDSLSLESAPWQDRNFVYYGGPDYKRFQNIVSDYIAPNAVVCQVQLTAYELGWSGWYGDNGTPAPYFDNVRLVAFTSEGPAITARDYELAQDNFPEIGHFNMNDLASMNVRFDAAINKGDDNLNAPGDSIVCDVTPLRAGGELVENRLYYTMQPNPVFDSVRDPAWEATGFVEGQPSINESGNIVPNKFAYDLPDSGFLFPGDVLHYYISATAEVDHSSPMTSTLPASLDGFGDFVNQLAFDSNFKVHCLPTLNTQGEQPPILFWNDYANGGGEEEWFGALLNIGLVHGIHYDYYYTNAPSSGVGNGLGGRATPELISGYSDLLYTCGDLGVSTLANGDPTFDQSPDLQLLTAWFTDNQVDAFFCGDNLASDLTRSGTLGNNFLNNYLNVVKESNDLRPLIGNQTTPLVKTESGNSVLFTTQSWIAYGGCDGINTFDAVTIGPGAERLAQFCNSAGNPDFVYSAATLNQVDDDRIISLPYDFMSVYTNPDGEINGLSARVNLLSEILDYFLESGFGFPADVPDASIFSVNNYPNPFNPQTRIDFNLPRAAHLSVKVFNIRGELVKTLLDEQREAGPDNVIWDGTNQKGSNVSSGIYFYEARIENDVKVGKMTLIK